MRGRFCTQPFLVEKQTRYPLSPRRFPSPAPLGESIAPSSAPVCALGHLWFMVASPGPDRTVPRTVRPPRGRLWVEKNPASQTSGPRKGRNKIQSVFCTDTRRAKNSAHPESASFAGAVRGASPNFGSPAQRVPKFLPFPARPAGGRAVTGVGLWAAGQAEKEGGPPQGPPNQSRESRGEKLSPLALFPPVSREKRGPPPGRRPTGRCAPRPVKAPTTRRVRSTAPFPRPGPGGNPRGRSGPAMVPTEPPTDGAAPQGQSKGQGLPAPSLRQ